MIELEGRIPELTALTTPDKFYQAMDLVMIKVGLQYYGKGARAPEDEQTTALKKERLELLAKRRELRAAATLEETDEEYIKVEDRLAELTRQ